RRLNMFFRARVSLASLILYLPKTQPVRRRGRAAFAAVMGGERCFKIFNCPLSSAHQNQRACHIPYLMVEERSGARAQRDDFPFGRDVEPIERFVWRIGLAMLRAEG